MLITPKVVKTLKNVTQLTAFEVDLQNNTATITTRPASLFHLDYLDQVSWPFWVRDVLTIPLGGLNSLSF